MPGKRTSFLNINYVAALSRICISNKISYSLDKLNNLRNLGTAAERSDLQISAGAQQDDFSEHHQHIQQNLDSVSVDGSRIPVWGHNGVAQQRSLDSRHNMYRFSGEVNSIDSYGEERFISTGYSSQGFAESQMCFSGNSVHNFGQSQQSASYHGSRNNAAYEQHSSSGPMLHDTGDRPYLNSVYSTRVGSVPEFSAKPVQKQTEEFDDVALGVSVEALDAFCDEGKLKEAVDLLKQLEKESIAVDFLRFMKLIEACGEAEALEEGKIVHEQVLRSFSPLSVSTCNKILEMYAKCGSMDDAYAMFNTMQRRNLTSWDTLITWLAKNGLAEKAIDLFNEFKNLGLKPDGEIFHGVFLACSVLGDTIEGMLHFESMKRDYGIVPSMSDYVSVVDMLGSCGYLDQALEFIEKMPLEPSVDIWETLMNLSRVHGHVELGDRCAAIVEQLDAPRLNEQSKAGLVPVKASDLAKQKEKKKPSAQNALEARSRVHEYRAGDTSHPDNYKLYALLRGMRTQMKEVGYVPETRFVLHDIDQESKEDALLAHSERLAIADGLLSSSARSTIRIIKNLRVCGDCHTALKIISKLVGREIVARDAKRFHHFRDGLCSCKDYW